jgi:hypothetical protein
MDGKTDASAAGGFGLGHSGFEIELCAAARPGRHGGKGGDKGGELAAIKHLWTPFP